MLRRASHSGFTLIELAIVVGVAGLLFSGLWRLMASGNSQLREQVAADQMNQLAAGIRGFISTDQGQKLLKDSMAAGQTYLLPFPILLADAAGSGTCPTSPGMGANFDKLCTMLPNGFYSGTVNAFNQTYRAYVRKFDGAVNTAPQNYDFVIVTSGGDTIPDTSGGRIAANTGANGGFIYADNVCGAGNACGAFGGFSIQAATLAAAPPAGFSPNPGAGHIVTLNSNAIAALGGNTTSDWLARRHIEAGASYVYNTMTEDLYMGGHADVPADHISNIEFNAPGGAFTNAGKINMRNGSINLNAGAGGATTGALNLDGGKVQGTGFIDVSNSSNAFPVASILTTSTLQPALQIVGQPCPITNPPPGGCIAAVNVSGSVNIIQDLAIQNTGRANQFQAATFIYSSDMRLKRDIEPLSRSLDKITSLQGFSFKWRKDGREDIGLVAQDVEKVYPTLVHKSGNGELGVEYGNLIAPMIEAIKELKQDNEGLRDQVRKQQQAIERLQKKRPI